MRRIEVLYNMSKGENQACNTCLDRNKRWAEQNREREKKNRNERKDQKKECNKEYAMREVDCLTCGRLEKACGGDIC